MFSSRDAFDNDFCPVRDELLGEMYRANENGLPRLVESISSDVSASMARTSDEMLSTRRGRPFSLARYISPSSSSRTGQKSLSKASRLENICSPPVRRMQCKSLT